MRFVYYCIFHNNFRIRTLYQTLPLHSAEEFRELRKAQQLELPEDPHKFMLARLEFELEERKRIIKEVEKETAKRNQLLADIQKQKDFISQIDQSFQAIQEVIVDVKFMFT